MDVSIACPCPDKGGEVRHPNGDTVRLRDKLDWSTVTVIRKAMSTVDEDDRQIEIAKQLAICTEFYMLMGIVSWTFTDDKGKPLAVSHAAIRELFERMDVLDISNAAEKLYNPVVLLPLVNRALASSQPSPTPTSTSPTSIHPSPQRPSKRSSTSTTPTDDIETTSSSLDGVSSSSQSAA